MLDGKIVLVTGATRGIGKAIALTLGNAGATIIGTATSKAGANNVSQILNDNKISGKGIVLDVTDNFQISRLDESIKKDFGSVDILVNNAGITRDNILLRMKEDEWEDIINTNLSSIYKMSKSVLRGMIKNRSGRIISITSVVGAMGNAGQSNYGASKAGIIGFTKSLAREVGVRGITVNAIAPGALNTSFLDDILKNGKGKIDEKLYEKQLELKKTGGVSMDYAVDLCLFLASAKSNGLTGKLISALWDNYEDWMENIDEVLAVGVRAERDNILATVVDPIVSNSFRWADFTDEKRTEWTVYRQALLDIPEQSGFPSDVTWPEKPS